MITSLADQLRRDEGIRRYPYQDMVGKTTIGVGRNLTDMGVNADEINLMLTNDINLATMMLENNFPWTAGLDDVRRGVLINMCFNMGIHSLASFRNMLAKVEAGDYAGAAQEMLDSQWATQVGDRAQRLAIQMESGQWQ